MNKKLRLLLAHSFNKATLSDVDLSDVNVAQWFKERIEEYSGGNIEVVSLDNAAGVDSIPDEIKAAIRDCDGVFCLLTRRYFDSFCNRWLAPEYVISESGYAQALYQSLTPWKRVVGFAEDGVDRNHLGIAFSGGQNVPTFARNNLDGCREALKSQVHSILSNFGQVRAQPSMVEAQRLHKNVIVRRDGFVVVYSRYSFLVRDPKELQPWTIKHHIWRILNRLPSAEELLAGKASLKATKPFLFARVVNCTDHDISHVRPDFVSFRTGHDGNELSFGLNFKGLECHTPCLLEYDLTWGYPFAFLKLKDLLLNSSGIHYNAVGLRAGARGKIAEATLRVFFERHWVDGSEAPIFDSTPQVYHSRCKDCPPELPPPIFYPNGKEEGGQWQTEGMMQQDVNDFDTYYEAYSETVTDLEGQILVCWKPAEDYHRYRRRTSQPTAKESPVNPR